MYAVISACGKQHRICEGEKLRIDYVAQKSKGDSIVFERIFMVKNDSGYQVGTPLVEGAKVEATIIDNGADDEGTKGKKILVFKRRRRTGYRKARGHRQRYTEIRIDKISC
jgi:large subunit ribosomal protein L21